MATRGSPRFGEVPDSYRYDSPAILKDGMMVRRLKDSQTEVCPRAVLARETRVIRVFRVLKAIRIIEAMIIKALFKLKGYKGDKVCNARRPQLVLLGSGSLCSCVRSCESTVKHDRQIKNKETSMVN